MSPKDNKKEDKKVLDITRPGKTPPSASARPIIVTHKPMVQDPMVSEPEAAKPEIAEPETAPPVLPQIINRGGKTIAPLEDTGPEQVASKLPGIKEATDNEAPAADPVETEIETAEKPEEPEPTSAPEPAPEVNQDSIPDDTAEIQEAAEETADKKATKETEDKEAKETQARTERVEELVTEKKYFVKVGEKRKRGSGWLVMIFLLLVVLAGAYLAVDAGLVEVDISLPYDLIKN